MTEMPTLDRPWLMLGDCLDRMREIPDGSVDLIAADLPYQITACAWDSVIPFDLLWAHYKRILKPVRPAVLTASQPFASALVTSNPAWFRWEDIWYKSNATGHLNAKIMPLRQHENILVFCDKGRVPYHPQFMDKESGVARSAQRTVKSKGAYGESKEGVFRKIPDNKGYPRSVVKFNTAYHERNAGLHPTQKPVGLFEYLIKTYTNPDEVVLDNCFGSGTTGVACANTGRRFIGIEKHEPYFDIGRRRIEQAIIAANQPAPIGGLFDEREAAE